MKEYIEKAKEEFKRVEHLIYVSLKYTRTVDVLRSVIERMISGMDLAVTGILEKAKRKKKISEVPVSPRMKCEDVRKLYPDDEALHGYLDFYLLLRKIIMAKYTKSTEYRRHVKMTVEIEGETIDVNIDLVYEYFEKINEFLTYIEEVLEGDGKAD